jgi:hypothetical protein
MSNNPARRTPSRDFFFGPPAGSPRFSEAGEAGFSGGGSTAGGVGSGDGTSGPSFAKASEGKGGTTRESELVAGGSGITGGSGGAGGGSIGSTGTGGWTAAGGGAFDLLASKISAISLLQTINKVTNLLLISD